jgi:hypothetical protein
MGQTHNISNIDKLALGTGNEKVHLAATCSVAMSDVAVYSTMLESTCDVCNGSLVSYM